MYEEALVEHQKALEALEVFLAVAKSNGQEQQWRPKYMISTST